MSTSDYSMAGKNALVTGAGSGIGLACAIALAQAGAKLALLGRTPEELESALLEIGGNESGHFMLTADVSSAEQMQTAFRTTEERWDRLDVVIANAGINGVWAPLEEMEIQEWDTTLAINLRGTFLTVKLALSLLKKAGDSSVIIVSSVNGNRMFSNSGASAYATSKAAQVAFAKMTALELARHRIRVNAICPGAIETHIDDSTERRDIEILHLPVKFPQGDVPLTRGRPGKAEDVAKVALFLASEASRHVSGTEIYVDGAQSLLQG
ncbi:MAG: short-chain dehydrogenase/reductase [Verrucomicrobiales bacterium]|nr:short-chain dehydrogenase/reductase [Verrucomicrobiales bacterium]